MTYPIRSENIQSKLSPKLSVAANTSIRIASVSIDKYISTLDPRSQGGHAILDDMPDSADIGFLLNYFIIEPVVLLRAPRFGI